MNDLNFFLLDLQSDVVNVGWGCRPKKKKWSQIQINALKQVENGG